jgi:hypothetical protein
MTNDEFKNWRKIMMQSRGWTAGIFISMLLVLMIGTTMAQDKKEVTVATQILQQYVGTYQLAPNFNLMITLEGSQLNAQASGQPKFPVFARSETRFFLKVVDAEIEFFKNDAGAISHLVLYQNQQEVKGSRTSDKVAEHKEITVSPAVLAQYVGTYELKPGFDVIITLEGDKLMSQATGQEKIQLFPETETKFFLKVTDAQVEFVKEGNNPANHLVLHQGPAEIKAARKP